MLIIVSSTNLYIITFIISKKNNQNSIKNHFFPLIFPYEIVKKS